MIDTCIRICMRRMYISKYANNSIIMFHCSEANHSDKVLLENLLLLKTEQLSK